MPQRLMPCKSPHCCSMGWRHPQRPCSFLHHAKFWATLLLCDEMVCNEVSVVAVFPNGFLVSCHPFDRTSCMRFPLKHLASCGEMLDWTVDYITIVPHMSTLCTDGTHAWNSC
mmetsp:Transcript_82331/g.129656  ORF Transcript_82331/g.129656 Transcript_82331/m.129656 type:complete len:113 (+) Transcript_82331:1439-1777(+)